MSTEKEPNWLAHRPPPPFIIPLIVYGILTALYLYFADYLIFGVWSPEIFDNPNLREAPIMPMMIVGYLIGGLLIAYTYPLWAWSDDLSEVVLRKRYVNGAFFGAMLALVIFLPAAFIEHSLFEGWELNSALAETGIRVLEFAIAGVAFDAVFKWPEKKGKVSSE